MKLLEKEELKGIDSTSKTIEKWDEFLKKAVVNLGYQDSLLERMYPYERGIPMIDGSRLPVDETTGRVFYKLSIADKLCGLLSTITSFTANMNGSFYKSHQLVKSFITYLCKEKEYINMFFPDIDDKTASKISEKIAEELVGIRSYHAYSIEPESSLLWKRFVDNCDIVYSQSANGAGSASKYDAVLSDEEKQQVLAGTFASSAGDSSYSAMFYWYMPFDDIYEHPLMNQVKIELMKFVQSFPTTSAFAKLDNFSEVYMQNYLVISLNPIDKLMCSTKQAFGSCMSIAKQNDAGGTSSGPAFGLPSLFGTDGVFLTFMTPGKHKNMYWESEEWNKMPENRDKEKAYKYLKMTCRALTYQGTLLKDVRDFAKALREHVNDAVIHRTLDNIKPDQERLFVGRQYSSCGEDYVWQGMVEFMMARQGIATGSAYGTQVTKLYNALKPYIQDCDTNYNRAVRSIDGQDQGISLTVKASPWQWTRVGFMTAPVPIEIDRYGYLRPIYYDNLSLNLSSEASAYAQVVDSYERTRRLEGKEPLTMITQNHCRPVIQVSSSRSGSGGVCSYRSKSGLDMFKIMTGKQDISYYNSFIKICSICKKPLHGTSHSHLGDKAEERFICEDCIKEQGLIKCPACGELHTKNETPAHEIYNIREITNPNNYEDMEPIPVCKKQLEKANAESFDAGTSSCFICVHCGKLDDNRAYYMSSAQRASFITVEFKGMNIKVGLDNECLSRATMCDRCKRLVFIDSEADICLLLPNKRVVCPDCIDKIRMKQERRNMFKDIFVSLTKEDLLEDEDKISDNLVTRVARNLAARRYGQLNTVKIKDVTKQIMSYLKAHPEEDFPVLKSATKPLESSSDFDMERFETVEAAPVPELLAAERSA